MADSVLKAEYEHAKHQCSVDSKSSEADGAILHLATISLKFLLNKCQPIDLVSRVPGKQYLSFKKGKIVARPANREMFLSDSNAIARLWKKWLAETIDPTDFAKLTYTIALAPCLAMELFDRQNKKGPATFGGVPAPGGNLKS